MKKYIAIFFVTLLMFSCFKNEENSNFTIDENIMDEVNSKIEKSELDNSFEPLFLVYNNVFLADYFEKDSITFSSRGKERRMPFKSFFFKRNDTLTLDGVFGLFGGFGFSLKIFDDNVTLYHLLSADDFPIYSKTKDGDLKFRIEVPCTETKVILSKMPEAKENEVIYGIVEFKSNIYYSAASIDNNENSNNREKNQMAMKIYFKSKYFDLENFEKERLNK